MAEKRPRPGPGQFQWNGGGWAGVQLGGSLWMLGAAVSLARPAPVVASIWLIAFVAVNAIGLAIWARRDRIRPFPALQWFLLVLGIAGLAGFGSMELMAPEVFEGSARSHHSWRVLLILPVLMGAFALMERGARAASRDASGSRQTP